MQMSTAHRFAFLCMPKCASSSIESAIAEHCNINFSGNDRFKHINAQDFQTFVMGYTRKVQRHLRITTFCLMRDPVDWLFSWYRYRQRKDLRDPNHPFAHNYTGNMSFDEFATAFMSEGERPTFANLPTQSEFLLLDNGEIGVDRVYSMDRLDLVAEFLSERIGKSIQVPHKNKAPSLAMELSPDIRNALEQSLARDVELFQQVREAGVLESA
ncbi:sulfotransferase family 2 domain-containing protein [Parahaliea mediterranea]|uniref:Sulfotransferase family 2 domain-containing protein n=1 Tax=Parahaliea mediterranea TaxID=651086 RepID=A0A939DBC4_9GAMM|nr:sulfotransferase family 2 domain-containing protein [Parahaliea mediterranea]MBN7795021.1 sulfotransferase family 2 domain-containing protein [Parahaliea mediterranea]